MNYFSRLSEIAVTPTSHQAGVKRILFPGDGISPLTQFAHGSMSAGERIEMHRHPTMDEYFYFLSGSGRYLIGEKSIEIHPDLAVHIPHDTLHELSASSNLTFIYFGLAITLP